MGLHKGQVAGGRFPDLIVLDAELGLLYTIVAGPIIYCNQIDRTNPTNVDQAWRNLYGSTESGNLNLNGKSWICLQEPQK